VGGLLSRASGCLLCCFGRRRRWRQFSNDLLHPSDLATVSCIAALGQVADLLFDCLHAVSWIGVVG